MTNVDQFESVFLSAIKDPFCYQATRFKNVLLITDLNASGAEALLQKARRFTAPLDHEDLSWHTLSGDLFQTTDQLLQQVKQMSPDLIVTHRNLHSEAWRFTHSLGEHLDVLAQRTRVPVLVLPHPRDTNAEVHGLDQSKRVMAVTNHLTDDHRLINHAAAFTSQGGLLFLVHIEDQAIFDRIIAAISRIPSIDTEEVRRKLSRQLLKEPHDYVSSCRRVLEEAGLPLKVEEKVAFGNHLKVYRDNVKEHQIDLLVMNTKDDDQLAMHGLAYPLAIELRMTPLLML